VERIGEYTPVEIIALSLVEIKISPYVRSMVDESGSLMALA
jgi:hypothetical protein